MNKWTTRKLEGKCPRCGCELPEDYEQIMCEKCILWERGYRVNLNIVRIENGQCCTCSKPYVGKYKNCDSCREKERDRKNAANKKKAVERWKNND